MARLKWLVLLMLFPLVGAANPSPVNNYYYSGNWYYVTLRALSPEPARVHQAHDASKQQHATQQGPSPSTVEPRATPTQISQASTNSNSCKATDRPQNWSYRDAFAPSTWSNWILAIFAVVAAVIGLRTLGRINTQAKAAVVALRINRVAANAALRSAKVAEQTVVDLERPWIFIDLEATEGFQRIPPQDGQMQPMFVTLQWAFKNYGRSPAFVFDGAARMRVLPKPMPETPDYGQPTDMVIPVPMPPNKSQPNNTVWPIEVWPISDTTEHRRLIRGEAVLVFYGFIKYRDTSKKEHISRWCAMLQIPSFRLTGQPETYWSFEGPPAYTEYT